METSVELFYSWAEMPWPEKWVPRSSWEEQHVRRAWAGKTPALNTWSFCSVNHPPQALWQPLPSSPSKMPSICMTLIKMLCKTTHYFAYSSSGLWGRENGWHLPPALGIMRWVRHRGTNHMLNLSSVVSHHHTISWDIREGWVRVTSRISLVGVQILAPSLWPWMSFLFPL